MKNLIIIVLFPAIFLTFSCRENKKSIHSRKDIINTVVNAISNNDTLKLYDLVDTSYCFEIYSKQGFLDKIDFVYNQLKLCGSAINFDSIKVNPKAVNATEYSLSFCTDKKTTADFDRFDLLLTFANYKEDTKVAYLDIQRSSFVPVNIPPIKRVE